MHTTNVTDVYDFLFPTIPQVKMSFKGTKEKWSSSRGFHLETTSGNTVGYLFGEVSSKDINYAPWMIKLLNTMFIHQQEKTSSSYSKILIECIIEQFLLNQYFKRKCICIHYLAILLMFFFFVVLLFLY